MKRLLGLLVALIVVAIGLSFAMLNPNPIALDFYFGMLTLPVSLWLGISLALGTVIGLLAAAGELLRQRWELSRPLRGAARHRAGAYTHFRAHEK